MSGRRVEDDDVAGLDPRDVDFLDRQGARILGRVEENGGDQAAQDDSAAALVGDERDVLADVPKDRVAGGFTGGAGADDVADEDHPAAFRPEAGDRLQPTGKTRQSHGQGMERDIGTGGGVLGRREIVGVDLAVDLEDRQGHGRRQDRLGQEPLAPTPGLNHRPGVGIARGQADDGFEGAIDKDGVFQGLGGRGRQGFVFQEFNQRADVVAAQHRPQHEDGVGRRDRRRPDFAAGRAGQPTGLDLGRRIDARRDPVAQQGDQLSGLSSRRIFQAAADFRGLFRAQGQGRDPQRAAFRGRFFVAFQHGGPPLGFENRIEAPSL